MTVKPSFPKMLLAVALASIFLLSMPSPGHCDRCQDLYKVFGPEQGWDTKVNSDTSSGKCTITATKTDPKTGEITNIKEEHDDNTGWGSRCTESVTPDGSTSSWCAGGYDDHWQWTSFKWTDGKGWELTKRYDSETGGLKSEEEKSADGSRSTKTYDPASCHEEVYEDESSDVVCRMTSDTRWSPDGSHTITTFASDGSATVTRYAPDGKAIAKYRKDVGTGEIIVVYNCNLLSLFGEECVDLHAGPEGLGQYGSNRPRDEPRQQTHEKKAPGGVESATNAPQIMPGVKPPGDLTGPRDKVKADVLGQIEGKHRGNLSRAKDKSQTGPVGHLEKKPGGDMGLKLPPLSPGGPAPDKSIQLKNTTRIEGPSVGHKEKSRIIRHSQSVGQMQLQGQGAAKQKIQTQAVQPFKGTTKRQDFRLPAGSSAPMLR